MIEIRQLKSDEWELLKDLRLGALADAPYAYGVNHAEEALFDEAKWRQRLDKGPWFVAFDAGVPVGIVGAAWFVDEWPQLISLWVKEDRRGSGVACELVEPIKAWAIDQGATELRLNFAEDNLRAARFWQKIGAQDAHFSEPLWNRPEVNCVDFRIELGRDDHNASY